MKLIKNFSIVLIFCGLFIFLSACNSNKVVYNPIGKIITKNNPAVGAPRQGILMPEVKGIIQLKDEYIKALYYLDSFEYISVFYHFNKAEGWESIVVPPKSHHKFGLFATRSPRRPNAIGFTVVRLDSVVGNSLYISGIDAFDGTPVLDIKPYLPSVDCPESKINEKIEQDLGHHDDKFLTDTLFR